MLKTKFFILITIIAVSATLTDARSRAKSGSYITIDEISALENSGHISSIGKNSWKTRGGLLLKGKDPDGNTRLEHIMKHASDSPSRPRHGVFSISKAEIIELLDETWKNTAGSQNSRGGKTAFTYDTGREIGYLGGREGSKNKHPGLRSVRLVVANNKEVITFFPY
jgi:hypothetical protein